MNYYFITGSSSGLGRSLTNLLLDDENNVIFGFARSKSIKHINYKHLNIDLSNLDEVKAYQFPELKNAERITLVNNAGMLGDVNRIGKIDNEQLITCYNLNLIAPSILTNNFISKYSNLTNEKFVLNISSGAGRSPIDGWSIYCSTKAGLDMFSQVLSEEVKIDNSNIKVLSLAPGIIDTGMQSKIRESDKNNFSNIEQFIAYKREGELVHPDDTAKQIIQYFFNEKLFKKTICSLRDFNEQ